MDLRSHPHRFVAAGAAVIALTTAAETLTAPYSDHVVLYELNPAAHVIKVVAAVVFVAAVLAMAARHRASLGRVGAGATVALAAGTTMGAIPYSVVEATLDPGLDPARAEARLDAAYAAHLAWIGPVAMAGMLLLLLGLVTMSVIVLRLRLLPRWRPVLGLAAPVLGVLAGVLGGATDLPVPHPPAWIFLCLAIAYDAPLAASTGRRPEPGGRPVRPSAAATR